MTRRLSAKIRSKDLWKWILRRTLRNAMKCHICVANRSEFHSNRVWLQIDARKRSKRSGHALDER